MQRYTVYLYLETALHVLGWYLHPSSGAHTIVSTASGVCHTVTATSRFRGRVGTSWNSIVTDHSVIILEREYTDSIPIYIQQDATLHSIFISGNCSTYFGWYLQPSSGAHTTVSTASGICHTVTATCRDSGR